MAVHNHALLPLQRSRYVFQRLMETALRGLTYESRLVYLVVIVIGRTFQERLRNLRKVLMWF
jgi:hypothetical protein